MAWADLGEEVAAEFDQRFQGRMEDALYGVVLRKRAATAAWRAQPCNKERIRQYTRRRYAAIRSDPARLADKRAQDRMYWRRRMADAARAAIRRAKRRAWARRRLAWIKADPARLAAWQAQERTRSAERRRQTKLRWEVTSCA